MTKLFLPSNIWFYLLPGTSLFISLSPRFLFTYFSPFSSQLLKILCSSRNELINLTANTRRRTLPLPPLSTLLLLMLPIGDVIKFVFNLGCCSPLPGMGGVGLHRLINNGGGKVFSYHILLFFFLLKSYCLLLEKHGQKLKNNL